MGCQTCPNQQMQGVPGGAVLAPIVLLLLGLFGYAVLSQRQEPQGRLP